MLKIDVLILFSMNSFLPVRCSL